MPEHSLESPSIAVSESLSPEMQELYASIAEGIRDTFVRVQELLGSKKQITSSERENLMNFVNTQPDELRTLQEMTDISIDLEPLFTTVERTRELLDQISVMSEEAEIRRLALEEKKRRTQAIIRENKERSERMRALREQASEKTIPAEDTAISAANDLAAVLESTGVDPKSMSKSYLKKSLKAAKRELKSADQATVCIRSAQVIFACHNGQLFIPAGGVTLAQ